MAALANLHSTIAASKSDLSHAIYSSTRLEYARPLADGPTPTSWRNCQRGAALA